MDNLDDILKKLLGANPEVKAAMILSIEGLPIINPQFTMGKLRVARNAALIEMEMGEFKQLYIGGSKGCLIVSQTGPDAEIIISTTNKARLGLIFPALERFFEDADRPSSSPGEIGVEGMMKPENIPGKKKLEDLGLSIVSALPEGIDETSMTIITAALFALAERAVIEMEKGEIRHMYIRRSEGYLIMLPAGPHTLLAVSTTNNVKLGLIFMECKRTAENYIWLCNRKETNQM